MCLCLVEGSYVEEDCVRLHTSGLVYDTVCSSIYVTICQRDADLGKQPRYLMLINEKWILATRGLICSSYSTHVIISIICLLASYSAKLLSLHVSFRVWKKKFI